MKSCVQIVCFFLVSFFRFEEGGILRPVPNRNPLKFVSANHFGPLLFPTCNFKFQVTLFLFHDSSQVGIVRGVVHSTPGFSFNCAQEIITGSRLKTDYVFSMQILLKMELQATKFSSVTVQRTLPGSLRI